MGLQTARLLFSATQAFPRASSSEGKTGYPSQFMSLFFGFCFVLFLCLDLKRVESLVRDTRSGPCTAHLYLHWLVGFNNLISIHKPTTQNNS